MKAWLLKMLIKYVIDYTPKGVKGFMAKIILWLSGKKMYLSALALVIEAIVVYIGDNDLNKLLTKLIAAWAIASAKSAIVKSGTDTK